MKLSATFLNSVVAASAISAVVSFDSTFTPVAQAQTVKGAGATFPAPLYERYAREIKKKYPNLSINYQGVGSGAGIRQFIAGTVDVGASDAAMTDAEIAKVSRGAILVPTAGGAVAYNLPGINNLRLSRKTLPAIFSGQMTGVPSIVVGIFAFGVIVLITKQFSAIAGGFALAVLMLSIVVLTIEKTLKLVPTSMRLGSAALGGTRFQTTFRVVVTAVLPAITTGVLLAVARASGETAPLLFTALFSLDWSREIIDPTASLSVLIFNLYNDPTPEKTALVWTASLVLVGIVMFISILSRIFTRRKNG